MYRTKIYIDGWFIQPPVRGVGQYIKNILLEIPKSNENIEYILLIPRFDLTLDFLPNFVKVKVIPCKFILFWYEYHLPKISKINKGSTIFYPSGTCGILMSNKYVNVASTIHDVSNLLPLKLSPITFKFKNIFGRIYRIFSFYKLINNSDLVFTVSKTAKEGIESFIKNKNFDFSKIHVVYNSSRITNLKLKNKKKYFLCITGESKQKNYKCILQALNKANLNSLFGWTFYLVGLDIDDVINHKSGALIIKKKYLDFKEIKDIYSKTYCYIFPSLFESFGIPLVDAQKSRCHIIASNQGASKEVCGNSALYFDPNSSNSLLKKILKIISEYPKPTKINTNSKIYNQSWAKTSKFIFKKIKDLN